MSLLCHHSTHKPNSNRPAPAPAKKSGYGSTTLQVSKVRWPGAREPRHCFQQRTFPTLDMKSSRSLALHRWLSCMQNIVLKEKLILIVLRKKHIAGRLPVDLKCNLIKLLLYVCSNWQKLGVRARDAATIKLHDQNFNFLIVYLASRSSGVRGRSGLALLTLRMWNSVFTLPDGLKQYWKQNFKHYKPFPLAKARRLKIIVFT